MELPLQGRCREFESLTAHFSKTFDYFRGFLFLYKSGKVVISNHCLSFIILLSQHNLIQLLISTKAGGIPRLIGSWYVYKIGTNIALFIDVS